MFIDFSDIAGHQNLFLDYLHEFDNVKSFYKNDFRNFNDYKNVFSSIASSPKEHRGKLVKIIQEQYSGLKPSRQTELNILSLENPKTIAVVTGQQLGIFGGPLYTFYKIITAVKLCSFLKTKFDGYNFVPVFWLEGDDHDFDEVSWLSYINKENELKTLEYKDNIPEEATRGSIGTLRFNENIEETIKEFSEGIRETEFTQEVISLLQNCYQKDKTFKEAFIQLLFYFFDEYGLVLFDPQDKEVKKILSPVFVSEIENYKEHTLKSLTVSAELEDIYHAQVKVKPVNLFYTDDSGRYPIEPDDNDFKLKNKRKKFSKSELISIAKETPEKFSPNVLLRPICQDYLLPTGIYIAGPGEINYFAQVIPLYDFFKTTAPIIYPRASVTIIEKNISAVVDKFGLNYADFFNNDNIITTKILAGISDIKLDEIFSHTKLDIFKMFDELKSKISSLDPSLNDNMEKTLEKIIQSIETLKQKSEKAQERKHETTLRQIDKTRMMLFPESTLQERILNFTYFTNKYGINFMKWLINEIAVDKFEHQIIKL